MGRLFWIVIGLAVGIGAYLYWKSIQLPLDIESKGGTPMKDWITLGISILGFLTAAANALKAMFDARKAAHSAK